MKQSEAVPKKKTRKAYTPQEKASIVLKFLEEEKNDPELSLGVFAQDHEISKSMLFYWIKDKNNILKKAYEGCILRKNR